MFADIVFPNNNEIEFIAMAKRLGYTYLYFIYSFEKYKISDSKLVKSGIISTSLNIQKTKKKTDFVIVKGSSKNRHVLEKQIPNVIYFLEGDSRKDFIHHRASGLNQVLAKIAHDNDIVVGFSFNSIFNTRVMGRISQNIKLCRKYKIKTLIASFAKNPYEMRAPADLISLFTHLGMHASEARQALIKRNI